MKENKKAAPLPKKVLIIGYVVFLIVVTVLWHSYRVSKRNTAINQYNTEQRR